MNSRIVPAALSILLGLLTVVESNADVGHLERFLASRLKGNEARAKVNIVSEGEDPLVVLDAELRHRHKTNGIVIYQNTVHRRFTVRDGDLVQGDRRLDLGMGVATTVGDVWDHLNIPTPQPPAPVYSFDSRLIEGDVRGPNEAQRWHLENVDANVYRLKNVRLNRHSKREGAASSRMVLDYTRTKDKFDVGLQSQAGRNGNTAQRWILEQTPDKDVYVIKNFRLCRDHEKEGVPSKNMVLDYTVTSAGEFVVDIQPMVGKHGNTAQRWIVTETDDGHVVIENLRLRGMLLDYTKRHVN